MWRQARRIDVNVRFGVHAHFAPYNSAESFPWGSSNVSLEMATVDRVLQAEIVWELSVLNFRLEFLALDRLLRKDIYEHDDQRAAAERESALFAIWNSGGVSPMWEVSPESIDPFSSRSIRNREDMIKRMANVLATWPGGESAFQLYQYQDHNVNGHVHSSRGSFIDFEESVFRFYIQLFSKTLNRLPTVPFLQPDSLSRHAKTTGKVLTMLSNESVFGA